MALYTGDSTCRPLLVLDILLSVDELFQLRGSLGQVPASYRNLFVKDVLLARDLFENSLAGSNSALDGCVVCV